MKKIFVAVCAMFILIGCAEQKRVNQMIIDSNAQRYEAFVSGMCNADSEGARIAISMGFASGMGMQNLYRENTFLDYLKAAHEIVNPYARLFFDDNKNDTQTMSAGGDIFFVSDGSSVSQSTETSDGE